MIKPQRMSEANLVILSRAWEERIEPDIVATAVVIPLLQHIAWQEQEIEVQRIKLEELYRMLTLYRLLHWAINKYCAWTLMRVVRRMR